MRFHYGSRCIDVPDADVSEITRAVGLRNPSSKSQIAVRVAYAAGVQQALRVLEAQRGKRREDELLARPDERAGEERE